MPRAVNWWLTAPVAPVAPMCSSRARKRGRTSRPQGARRRSRRCRWLGHRHVDCTRPSRARNGVAGCAFAPMRSPKNLPARDLLLSADHTLLFDGWLVPARRWCGRRLPQHGGFVREVWNYRVPQRRRPAAAIPAVCPVPRRFRTRPDPSGASYWRRVQDFIACRRGILEYSRVFPCPRLPRAFKDVPI